MNNIPFERTVCACSQCAKCCEFGSGYLIPSDIKRIAEHTGMELEDFLETGIGATVGINTQAGLKTMKIPTLKIKGVGQLKEWRPNHFRQACMFFKDGRCGIHAVSPFGCAFMDLHMSKAEGDKRSTWGLHRIMEQPSYWSLWNHIANIQPAEVMPKAGI